ncbi:leucine-rich repeat domain-containing protein [Adhaeribacter aquaticus]|uniref:leucine-rich repeat domain-containing protein n=1 Tax=Adhaeribacter aquaticus TaxID=299567 RepID=UPI000410F740|nr:leucine-rich repeat domain-containing protein [Adhaeribacter aquaticus]
MEKLENYKKRYLNFIKTNKPPTQSLIIDFFDSYESSRNLLNNDRFELEELTHDIQFLDLSKRNLSAIPKEVLDLPNLKCLDLSNNNITSFTGLEKLTKLEVLFLEGCNIKEFPVEIFSLKELTSLNINGNQIKYFDENITKLSKLTGLNLSDNDFGIIPTYVLELPSLTGLFAAENTNITFESTEFISSNIKELELIGCGLKEFPIIITKFSAINTIYLMDNNLKSLPNDFKLLKNLVSIDLGNNKFKEIPNELIEILGNLETLDISYNNIKEINFDFKPAKKLRKLDLSGNRIKSLPSNFDSLDNLLFLELNDNELEFIDEDIFHNTNRIKFLSLQNNYLKTVPKSIGELKNLTDLNLMNNCLEILPSEIGGLIKLKKLNLGNYNFYRNDKTNFNILETLPNEIGNLKNLEEIDVSENKLIDLPNEFANLRKLTSLRKGNNPFSSSPELANMGIDELFEFLNKRRGFGTFDLRWEVPQPLQTAFQRYFDNFSNFYQKTQGVEIQFEVIKDNQGLLFKLHPNEDANLEQISASLFEYVSLLEQDRENLIINYNGKNLSQYEFDLLIADIKEEKRSFEAKVELAKMEARYNNLQIDGLKNHIDDLKLVICNYQHLTLEQSKKSIQSKETIIRQNFHLNMPENTFELSNIGNPNNSSNNSNINTANSSSSNTNSLKISINDFQDLVADAIGNINVLQKALSKENNSEIQAATKDLEEVKEVLESAFTAEDKNQIKKTGLKGFIKGFSNSLTNIYNLISDKETVDSVKKAIEAVSDGIEMIG